MCPRFSTFARLQKLLPLSETAFKMSIVLTIVFRLVVIAAGAQGNSEFHVEPEFNDKLCIPEIPSSTMNFSVPTSLGGCSKLACASQCSLTDGCKGVFYNRAKKTCVGGDEVVNDNSGCLDDTGSVYLKAVIEEATITLKYLDACNGTVPCSGDNVVCWDGTCLCQPGYSLLPSKTLCVAECESVNSALGTAFQGYPGWRFASPNMLNRWGLDLVQCQELCANWTPSPAACTGVNFTPSTGECNLKETTALTRPDDLKVSGTKDYYHRNCQ